MTVFLRNEGNVPVWVAKATYHGKDNYIVTGWYKLYPKSDGPFAPFGEKQYSVEILFRHYIYGEYFLAFVTKDENGRMGVMRYDFSEYKYLKNADKNVCVYSDFLIMDHIKSNSEFCKNSNVKSIPFTGRILPDFFNVPDLQTNWISIYPKSTDVPIRYLDDKIDVSAERTSSPPQKPNLSPQPVELNYDTPRNWSKDIMISNCQGYFYQTMGYYSEFSKANCECQVDYMANNHMYISSKNKKALLDYSILGGWENAIKGIRKEHPEFIKRYDLYVKNNCDNISASKARKQNKIGNVKLPSKN